MVNNNPENRKSGGSFSKCDVLFGHRINLQFNGKEHFGTNCGAIISIFVISCLVIFFIAEFKQILFRYFGIEKYGYLSNTPLSSVTYYDEELLIDGYDLRDKKDFFTIAVGIKSEQTADISTA